MGDFDRVQNPSAKNESKKIGLVILLGLVLVGVVVFHFTKQGPQVASAAPGPLGNPTPDPIAATESPDKALTALEQDPTAHLLPAPAIEDPTLSKVPRNPFRISSVMLAGIVKPVEIVTPQPAPTVPIPTTPQVIKPIEPPLRIEDYKLSSVLHVGGKLTAVINGKIVSSGMLVDKARVLDIREDGVTLQNSQAPDGPTINLNMQPRMK